MPAEGIDRQLRALRDRLDRYLEEYEAANSQITRVLSDVERLKIERQIKDLDKQISLVRAQIEKLASLPASSTAIGRIALAMPVEYEQELVAPGVQSFDSLATSADDLPPMNKEAWLKRLGFDFSPFDHPFSDQPFDKHLAEYAIDFPYFDEVVTSDGSIVFARKGHGKSAYRLQVKHVLERRNVPRRSLVLDYTDFKRTYTVSSSESHCDEILRLALRRLLSIHGEEFSENNRELSHLARTNLSWLVNRYGDHSFNHSQIERQEKAEQLNALKRRRHQLELIKAKKGYETPSDIVLESEDIAIQIGSLEQSIGSERIILPDTDLTVTEKLERLHTLLDSQDMDVVVLVDPDLPDDGTWSLEVQRDLIRPLISSLPFRKFLHLKLFLPLELAQILQDPELRTSGKFWEPRRLDWTRNDLDRMLRERLRVAGDCHSFDDLVESSGVPVKVHDRILDLADGSPRELVRLCRLIFNEHVKRPTRQLRFSEQEIEYAFSMFSPMQNSD